MKTWTPDTSDPVADWHRGQVNDQAREFARLHGHDLLTKALRTRQTPLTGRDYLRLLGKSRSEIEAIEALTAPPVTKAKAALGKGAIAGGATTYAPGFSPRELAAVLTKARAGDPEAQAVWRAYAQTDPSAAGALIKQANAQVIKAKRKSKAAKVSVPRNGRGSVQVPGSAADDLADQAAAWQRRLATPPAPPVTKSAPAANEAIRYYARAGNPAARALLLEGAH